MKPLYVGIFLAWLAAITLGWMFWAIAGVVALAVGGNIAVRFVLDLQNSVDTTRLLLEQERSLTPEQREQRFQRDEELRLQQEQQRLELERAAAVREENFRAEQERQRQLAVQAESQKIIPTPLKGQLIASAASIALGLLARALTGHHVHHPHHHHRMH